MKIILLLAALSVTAHANVSVDNLSAKNVTVSSDLKLSSGTANRVCYLDASKNFVASSVTDTELGYLGGVSSNIQTQLNAKEATISAGTSAQYYRGDKSMQTLDTLAVPENTNQYFTNARAIAAPLTGFASAPGTISAADSVLGAVQKLDGNRFWGVPDGVFINNANKCFAQPTFTGLQMRCNDSATQTNAAGGFVGSGAGNAMFVTLNQLDGANLSTFSGFSFNAKLFYDTTPTTYGQIAVNIITNFANGWYASASDYANLLWDNLPSTSVNYFPLTTTPTTYSLGPNDRSIRSPVGTGTIVQNCTATSGSPTLTSCANPNSITVGNYMKQYPTTTSLTPDSAGAFPDGTTIISVNAAGSSVTLSANANSSGVKSMIEYGGIAPVDRAATGAGTTTVTLGARADGITTTTDLRVGMKVSGTNVPALSYIVSMVANTSITLNNSVSAGATTLSFVASGLSGIPVNTDPVGVSLARISANNPSAIFGNPFSPGAWGTVDGGFAKNVTFSSVTLKMGSSGASSRDPRMVLLRNMTLNGTSYQFGN